MPLDLLRNNNDLRWYPLYILMFTFRVGQLTTVSSVLTISISSEKITRIFQFLVGNLISFAVSNLLFSLHTISAENAHTTNLFLCHLSNLYLSLRSNAEMAQAQLGFEITWSIIFMTWKSACAGTQTKPKGGSHLHGNDNHLVFKVGASGITYIFLWTRWNVGANWCNVGAGICRSLICRTRVKTLYCRQYNLQSSERVSFLF